MHTNPHVDTYNMSKDHTHVLSLSECSVINDLTLRDGALLCVDGWFCPQGTENRPSPCIDLFMSSSYSKIHKVCATPNRILMSEGFWVIVKNALLC